MKLVIVESPNKCHTISRYLGNGYKVLASKGHLRDLSTSGKGGFGIDVENNFKPKYNVINSKYKIVNELKTAAHNASEVILATDPDREGEAIAWHITQILGLDPKTTKRLEFHEITRASIEEAISHPRVIDMNLVNSQETRRIIDRVIGFRLTSIISKKINSKSAGRVQSATLKLIYNHDEEIAKFVPEEYWNLSLETEKDGKKVNANFLSYKDMKEIKNSKDNDLILSKLGKTLEVVDVKASFKQVESKPAFTTSTLQQEAFNVYHFSTKKTAKIAQDLYEGVDIGTEHVGLITYIRTDSTYLSDTYVERAQAFIEERFGKEYCGKRKTVKVAGAQNAHEAIRPTSNHRTPESLRKYLKPEMYKLYKLIYERAVASLMVPKKESVATITLKSGDVSFEIKGTKTVFDGFTRLYRSEPSEDNYIPVFKVGDVLPILNVNNTQEFTKAPSAYSEAKIVKLMEEKNIGRPSTYSSTISTLFERQYIESKGGLVNTTDQGKRTTLFLDEYFPRLIDAKYTADMEAALDKIQSGEESKTEVLTGFYTNFMKQADEVSKAINKKIMTEIGRSCPVCGKPLVMKKSKYGEFVGCSNFPTCTYSEKEPELVSYVGRDCPICGKPLVYRKNKKNKKFIACSGYPTCDYIEKQETKVVVIKKCPDCGGDLVIRGKGKKRFLGCTNFPSCKHIEPYDDKKTNE